MDLVLDCPYGLVIKNLKFFISKFRYEGSETTEEDLAVLHCLFNKALERSSRDYCWKTKYAFHLCEMKGFVSNIKPGLSFEQSVKEIWWRFPRFSLDWILTPNAYFGMKGNQDFKKARLVRKYREAKKSSFFKRWMAVGYKDQGTRRDPSVNGLPCWKEVAVSEKSREIYRNDFKSDFSLDSPPDLLNEGGTFLRNSRKNLSTSSKVVVTNQRRQKRSIRS